MRGKKLLTILILIVALGVGGYAVYSEWKEEQLAAQNEERLKKYLEEQYEQELVLPGIKKGDMAIDIKLPTLHTEEEISISNFKGEFLVMNLWASWCPPCIDEMPYLLQFYEEYKDEVQMIGVNLTTEETSMDRVTSFVDDFQIPYPILLDEKGKLSYEYRVMSIPMTYIIDPDGKIALRHIGYLNYDILVHLYKEAQQAYKDDAY